MRPKVTQLGRAEVGGIHTQVRLIPKTLFFHDIPSLPRLFEANRGPETERDLPNADPDLWASCPRSFLGETGRPCLWSLAPARTQEGQLHAQCYWVSRRPWRRDALSCFTDEGPKSWVIWHVQVTWGVHRHAETQDTH